MSCVQDLLSRVAAEVQAQLKPNLQGFAGMFVSGYLPQAWVFVTEAEAVTFLVDSRGNASVVAGRGPNPDVTIESFTGRPVFSQAERQRLVELMRAAGFPACAKAETLARSPQLVQLPECHAK